MSVRQVAFVTWLAAVSVIPGMPNYPQESYRSPFSSLMRLADLNPKSTYYEVTSKIKVVGGKPARPGQFPYQVSIQVRNYYGGYDHNCGGVIYDSSHIITAAHCLRGYHHRNLKIVAGEHELFKDEGSEQYRDALGYVFHPNFDPIVLDNDIGIITLDHPLDLNDRVQPLRIPERISDLPKTAQTSGWGNDGQSEGLQPNLLFVDLQVFTKAECVQAYENVAIVTDRMICAGDENGGKGSCSGDSGSGLTCKIGGTEYLCGLVSWGMKPCALPEYPTVFTDINSYLDWLHGLLPPQE